MSYSNEELIEELMWDAYEKGMGTNLIDLASDIQSKEKMERVDAFQSAYIQLGIRQIKIAKFKKNKNGSKQLVCSECDIPIKEYWRMDSDEKRAADREITIPAQYCENCKTNI